LYVRFAAPDRGIHHIEATKAYVSQGVMPKEEFMCAVNYPPRPRNIKIKGESAGRLHYVVRLVRFGSKRFGKVLGTIKYNGRVTEQDRDLDRVLAQEKWSRWEQFSSFAFRVSVGSSSVIDASTAAEIYAYISTREQETSAFSQQNLINVRIATRRSGKSYHHIVYILDAVNPFNIRNKELSEEAINNLEACLNVGSIDIAKLPFVVPEYSVITGAPTGIFDILRSSSLQEAAVRLTNWKEGVPLLEKKKIPLFVPNSRN
jgi:hypothetical protein